MKVLQFPLARITIGYIVGILAAFYLKPELTIVFGLLFISVLILVISYFVQKNKYTNAVYFGIATFIVSFFIGATTQIPNRQKPEPI